MTNSRKIRGPASRVDGDEQGTHGWYHQAKETKRGEKDGRESEHFVGALKRGNGPCRTPWSEGGAASLGRKPEPQRGHRTSSCVTVRWADRERDSESTTRRARCG